MSLTSLSNNYTAYNLWANEAMIACLRNTEKELLNKTVPSSFSSINLTIQHMLRAQKFWLAFIKQEDTSGFKWAVRNEDIEVYFEELIDNSSELKRICGLYTEAELIETLSLQQSWAQNKLPRYEYILHVVNHSTFHRGQLVTILRMLGVKEGIPATDYNIWNCREQ
jgi:uncharacterized damage-inducible protein DinB